MLVTNNQAASAEAPNQQSDAHQTQSTIKAGVPGYTFNMEGNANFDDSSFASDDSDWSEDMMDLEERVQEYSIMGTTPALAAMVFEFKMPKGRPEGFSDGHSVTSAHSAPVAVSSNLTVRSRNSDVCLQDLDYTSVHSKSTLGGDDEDLMKPDEFLRTFLASRGTRTRTFPYDSIEGFFLEMGPENYAAYDENIARASRNGDLAAVEAHIQTGKTLQCCNRFKESIVHTVCRRAHVNLLRFMLEKTDISLQICDDLGRTPLHDAAWTREPNFELVGLILERCPDLLYIADNRGLTPLAYIGKPCWKQWCDFLELNCAKLAPKELSFK